MLSGTLTLQHELLFFLWKSEELLDAFEYTFLQTGGHPMANNLEEAIMQTALSDLGDQFRFGVFIVSVKCCTQSVRGYQSFRFNLGALT